MKMMEIAITAEDIRHARPKDLEALTGVDAANWSAWAKSRSLTDRTISNVAKTLGMTPGEFLAGWLLRRQDAAARTATERKISQVLAERQASSAA